MAEKKPSPKVRYLVLLNPTWEDESVVEAHNPAAAIAAVAGQEEGRYVAVPFRYVKVIEIAPADVPPVPQMTVTEKDTAAWLTELSTPSEPVYDPGLNAASGDTMPVSVGEPV